MGIKNKFLKTFFSRPFFRQSTVYLFEIRVMFPPRPFLPDCLCLREGLETGRKEAEGVEPTPSFPPLYSMP